jgi:uncharacterized protein YbaR (Trm112 family)
MEFKDGYSSESHKCPRCKSNYTFALDTKEKEFTILSTSYFGIEVELLCKECNLLFRIVRDIVIKDEGE